MCTKVTLCIGLNDKDTKHQEITTAAAAELVHPFAVEMKTALNQESIYSDFVECEAIMF